MKTLVAVVLAATTFAATAPAFAQPAPGEWTLERRESWLQERLDRAASNGDLTAHDAGRAQKDLEKIMSLQDKMIRDDGGALRPSDRRELEGRLDQLDGTLRWARNEDAPPWRR